MTLFIYHKLTYEEEAITPAFGFKAVIIAILRKRLLLAIGRPFMNVG